jgi:dTDP-4-dehydrorhamnose reductase
MKILVTGGSGLVGNKLVKELFTRGHDVIAIYNSRKPSDPYNIKWIQLDITLRYKLEDLIYKERPNVIVHAAALTDVDVCEVEKGKAWQVNVEATRSIAKAAKTINAFLIYISTDYVFNGEKGKYKEEDIPSPINHYGITKLIGEEIVKSSEILYSIVRISAPFGMGGNKKGFALYAAEKLMKGEEIKALIDQYVSPTYNVFLARCIASVVEKKIPGVLHIAGERMNRYEFAIKIAEYLGVSKSLVKPAKMTEMQNWIAKRPRDSSLDTSKAKNILGDWHDSLKDIESFTEEFLKAYWDKK